MFSHRKLHHANEAIELLNKALEFAAHDFRLHLEYAKALWLKWRDESSTRPANHYLDAALDHLRTASSEIRGSSSEERDARVQIDNVAAFIHTERAVKGIVYGGDSLDKAFAHIQNMQRLRSETKWVGRFFDTRGYWSCAKAQSLMPERTEEKLALLESALRDVDKALESDETVGDVTSIRREHRDPIVDALEKVRSA